MKTLKYLPFIISCMTACTAETLGHDSDGDGLSDEQELLFCTDPHNPDTDGDTIPDSQDPNPCERPKILLTAQITQSTSEQNSASAQIMISVKDDRQTWRPDVQIDVSTTFGSLSPIQSLGTGLYSIQLTSDTNGSAVVTIQTVTDGTPDDRAAESILVQLQLKSDTPTNPGDPLTPPGQIDPNNPPTQPDPDQQGNDIIDESHVILEVPGTNPGRYAQAGKINGDLWVMAIDGNTLDWSDATLAPSPNAYVQVDLPDGTSLYGTTNAQGWVHFTDERLKGPVTITVGAKDARYVSWIDVNSRIVSAPIHLRDITPAEAASKGATLTGTVRGFWGETGIPSFPKENSNVFGTINLAIVQVGIRNTPLSSMNTGAILLPPDGNSATAEFFEIPPNLVLANKNNPDISKFTLTALKPGKYTLFALAGAGSNILEASKNPYEMRFTPMALGITEVEVTAGQTTAIDIDLTIDFRSTQTEKTALHFGQLPNDPKTNQPLPMGLILPLINTGKGYIFTDVNSAWNFSDFKNPVSVIYPKADHNTITSHKLNVHPMAVGLAARKAQDGFDLPGISTLIAHPAQSGTMLPIYMNDRNKWPSLPTFLTPTPPQSDALDAVGGTLNPSRQIAWNGPEDVDMTVLRFSYMTPPIHNKILNSDIGASQAHLLWEVYVPSQKSSITLPKLATSAPDYPVLVNYAPTSPKDAYQYDANTIEIEISPYYMGPNPFNYNSFLLDDVNMNAWGVSQDSYLVHVD